MIPGAQQRPEVSLKLLYSFLKIFKKCRYFRCTSLPRSKQYRQKQFTPILLKIYSRIKLVYSRRPTTTRSESKIIKEKVWLKNVRLRRSQKENSKILKVHLDPKN